MQKTILRYSQLTCAVLFGAAVGHVQDVQAGAYGAIGGTGIGWLSVDVRSATFKTNKVITPSNYTVPTASEPRVTGYTFATNLPSGASTNTYIRAKASPLGGWTKTFRVVTGDGVDASPEFKAKLNNLTPEACAELTVVTVINQEVVTENSISGTIDVTTKATGGTALWLRGYEYTGADPIPADDLDTPINEAIEFLKTNGGVFKFETLIVGPFSFGVDGPNGACPLRVPFSIKTTNIAHLIVALDVTGLSTPFVVKCPSDVTFNCGDAVTFPAADVTGGCGQITGTWSLGENYAFPVGTTPVTVTATDENGDTATCTFNVRITDGQPPLTPVLPDLNYTICNGSTVTPPAPTTTDLCGGRTITGTTTNVFPITTLGTTNVTWTFDDGHGNKTTAQQKVTTVSGLTFSGFYAPINGTGGACNAPKITKAINSTLPIKFDVKCGNTFITGGAPPKVYIQAYNSNCDPVGEPFGGDAVYQNNWHYNWTVSRGDTGTYEITIVLPDLSSQKVFVKLK